MCGYALPPAVSEQPVVRVPATAARPVGFKVGCARMNNREIAENADDYVMLAYVLYRGAAADLRNKLAAVDKCAIRIGVKKIASQVSIKPRGVGLVH